ncbi:MAG: hypothetical protein IJF87_05935 [Erysipelotrichaceae bacterium]|nr:hypothetical protein [Erysipelotrichaceae bacterium]
MTRTVIWQERIDGSPFDKEYVCQIYDDNGNFLKLVHEKTYEEAKNKVHEIMYGKEE